MKKKYNDRSTVREVRLSIRISLKDLERLERLRDCVDLVRGRVSQSLAVSHALYMADERLKKK